MNQEDLKFILCALLNHNLKEGKQVYSRLLQALKLT